MLKKARKKLYNFVEESTFFNTAILVLIALNVLSIVLESFCVLKNTYETHFVFFEIFTVIIFTVEYIARLLVADYKYPHKKITASITKYIFSPLTIIDLLAILPFYLPMFIPLDLRFVRVFRLVRVTRILKAAKYSNAINLIQKVLRKEKEQLLVTLYLSFLILFLASVLMYYIERQAQPEIFPNIPAAFWWGVATLTTVGYGDVFPVTSLGKILSTIKEGAGY